VLTSVRLTWPCKHLQAGTSLASENYFIWSGFIKLTAAMGLPIDRRSKQEKYEDMLSIGKLELIMSLQSSTHIVSHLVSVTF
jgi:hypothetical protein